MRGRPGGLFVHGAPRPLVCAASAPIADSAGWSCLQGGSSSPLLSPDGLDAPSSALGSEPRTWPRAVPQDPPPGEAAEDRGRCIAEPHPRHLSSLMHCWVSLPTGLVPPSAVSFVSRVTTALWPLLLVPPSPSPRGLAPGGCL